MAKVWMSDPTVGAFAIFDEPVESGDVADPYSARNAPLSDPEGNLPHLYFHSDFDNLEIASETLVNINHASVAAASMPAEYDAVSAWGWSTATADHLLVTHGLGYVLFALVAYDDNLLFPGSPVQADGVGGMRFVTAYCTASEVRLHEFASAGAASLGAVSRSYRILVFRAPRAPANSYLFDWDPATGVFQCAFDRFNSSRRYLQVVPGGTPYGLATGRTIDLDNGAPRFVMPDGTTYDPVPAISLAFTPAYVAGGGDTIEYQGAFAGSPAVEVQAP